MKALEGIHRYRKLGHAEHARDLEALAAGQKPELLLITCADSRIVPSLLTQSGPGEVFVIRNAGNFVPPWGEQGGGEAATIEYGIEALGIRHIAVCGHTHCGAMAAALDPASAASLPAVSAWLDHAAKSVERSVEIDAGGDRLVEAVAANVLTQIEHLRTHPSVKAAEERGELEIHAWVYDFVSGDVFAADQAGRFERLDESAGKAA
jgi:carbonic anhydrase